MRRFCAAAFTLVEVLVVIATIAVLAAFLFPVIARAKTEAQKPVCVSNLRQATAALNLYLESSDGRYPATTLLGKTVRATPVLAGTPTLTFHCPLDRPKGFGGLPFDDREEPLSYMRTWFLWEGDEGVAAWDQLLQFDANPVLLRCLLHDDYHRKLVLNGDASGAGFLENASSLAARKDGSVVFQREGRVKETPSDPVTGVGEIDVKRSVWSQATDIPCPETICDGKAPKEGFRDL